METKKVRVIAPNHTDIVHPETDASVVLTTGGQTVQEVIDGLYTPEVFTSTTDGLVPLSGGGTVKYLRADGTWVTPPDTNTTYNNATTSVSGLMSSTDKTKLDGIATSATNTVNHATNGSITVNGVEQVVYAHPTTSGNKHIPSGGSANQILRWSADGTAVWSVENNTVYTHPTGDGNLHVPATSTTNSGKVLKAGATAGSLVWADDLNTTYANATTSVSGLMSNTDKTKLDGVSTGATKTINHATNGSISVDGVEQVVYAHPTTSGNKHIPSGGSAGQFLKWSADGTATWAADNDTIYTHPATHPPSIIAQDTSNRFVSDAEKTTWNAKGTSNLALGTTSTTAYRGDYGNTAYSHSQDPHAPANAQVNQTLTSGNGMAAWTATSGDLTIALGNPSTLTTGTTNSVTSTSHTHAVTFPVTSVAGKTGAVSVALGDLSNVSTATPAVDNVLKWNGASWVPSSGSYSEGITTVDGTKIKVGNPITSIGTLIDDSGFVVSTQDGASNIVDLIAVTGSGASIPQLTVDHIDGDVLTLIKENITLNVDGVEYTSINSALASLGNRRIIANDKAITINVSTSVTEQVKLENWQGSGELIIQFSTNGKLFGSISTSGNAAKIRIKGNGGQGFIKRTDADNAVKVSGDKYVEIRSLNIDNNAGDMAIRMQDGAFGYVTACDIANTNFAVSCYDAAQVFCISNKGYANTNAYRTSSAAIYARNTAPNCPGTVELVYGHYFASGTITKTASSFTPPVLTLTTFTQTFKPIKIHTTAHDGTTVSTYYGSTAVQGKWNTMSDFKDGHITFSNEVGEFLAGADSITSITLRLKRKDSSHGLVTAVKPDPYKVDVNGSTTLSSTFNSITWGTGATIGGWSATQALTSSYFSASGNTEFVFYSSTVDSGYAIWSDAEVVVTIKKYV